MIWEVRSALEQLAVHPVHYLAWKGVHAQHCRICIHIIKIIP